MVFFYNMIPFEHLIIISGLIFAVAIVLIAGMVVTISLTVSLEFDNVT